MSLFPDIACVFERLGSRVGHVFGYKYMLYFVHGAAFHKVALALGFSCRNIGTCLSVCHSTCKIVLMGTVFGIRVTVEFCVFLAFHRRV